VHRRMCSVALWPFITSFLMTFFSLKRHARLIMLPNVFLSHA
jgi:hypothetical protein